jgi:hypothetical protein
VKELLQWTALQINRRSFLKRTLGGAFAAYAGMTVGSSASAVAQSCPYPCIGPYGTGRCTTKVTGTCSGSACHDVYGVSCNYVTGFCPSGSACWSTSGHVCCDCHCGDMYGRSWYCYCSS